MRLNYLIVGLVSILIWLIVFLIMMFLRIHTSVWSLLLAFTVCCLISLIVFVLANSSQREAHEQIEECGRKVQEYQKQLQQKNEIINQKICECDATKNKHLQELIALRDMMCALKTYIRLSSLRSSVGNLRNNNKEKAENQIADAQNITDEIIQNTEFQLFQFFAEIAILEDEYQKILKGYKSK